MSGQVSRGSAGEYQADEWAGVTRLSWRAEVIAISPGNLDSKNKFPLIIYIQQQLPVKGENDQHFPGTISPM